MKIKNKSIKSAFLIGILGTGMTSMAKYLIDNNIDVSGSDVQELDKHQYLYSYRDRIRFYNRHSAANILEAMPDEVIYSKAIDRDNPELLCAEERGISISSRPEKLAQITEEKRLVLITGTHGKSTITALSSNIGMSGEKKPSFMIGAIPVDFPPAMEFTESEYFILEGDESNRDILLLSPEILLISSMEWDHPESYTKDEFIDLFKELIEKKSIKTVIYNSSYKDLANLIDAKRRKINCISYSAYETADVFLKERLNHTDFVLDYYSEAIEVKTQIFGLYNAENFIASFTLMKELGIPKNIILESMKRYKGVSKRLEYIGKKDNLQIYIDYSHHPTELRSALDALREKHRGTRIILAFEPHMPSRLKYFFNDFVNAFSFADKLILTEVFKARMDPNESFNITGSINDIRKYFPDVIFIEAYKSIISYIKDNTGEKAVMLISSAGPLGEYVKRYFKDE